MLIERAVIAPVVPAWPTAVAHWPTARAAEVAVVRCVKVVEEVSVTTTLEVFFVWGLVSLTVTTDPLTAVTAPDAAPKPARPAKLRAPAGRSPEPPPGNPPPPPAPPAPRPNPPAPPPNPPVQAPDVGWVTVTVVAVTGSPNTDVADDEVDVGLPNAEMHEPTVTSAAVAATDCSKVVVGV